MPAISVAALSKVFKETSHPVLVDVRRQGARQESGQTLANALWRDPALWLDWKDEIAALTGPVVFFCVHGHEISQGLTAALCAMDQDAHYLEGGFVQWQTQGLPVVAVATGPH